MASLAMNHVLERAVFEQDADVVSLFNSTETWLPNDALADVYGLPHPPPGGGWVPYGSGGRAGILSTGAILTMGAKAGDTSPTRRYVRRGRHLWVHLAAWPWWPVVDGGDKVGGPMPDRWWELPRVVETYATWLNLMPDGSRRRPSA